jgi:hypothetical protein
MEQAPAASLSSNLLAACSSALPHRLELPLLTCDSSPPVPPSPSSLSSSQGLHIPAGQETQETIKPRARRI